MPSEYMALLQRRADLVSEGESIFARAESEARDLSDAEKSRDDEINAQVLRLNEDIAREDRRRARQLEAELPKISVIGDRAEDDPKRGFRNLADFALAVRAASTPGSTMDPRLRYTAAPTGYIQEAGSSAGDGYMVPPDFSNIVKDLVDAIENDVNLFARMNPQNTSSNTVQRPVDDTTVWSGSGIYAQWRNEGSQMSATRLVTKFRDIQLYELYVFTLATQEMMADVANLDQRLGEESGEAFNWKLGEAILNGTGAGMPKGIMNGPIVTQAAESGQTAATIVAANIVKMFGRAIHGPNDFWLIGNDAISQLPLMSIGNQPVWLPPTGFLAAPGGTLLGRPVLISQHCQTLGTAGDILYINPDGYMAFQRSTTPDFQTSIHLYFDYGIQAFRWMLRFGGEPALSAAISPAHGSNTLSHFVSLATRS